MGHLMEVMTNMVYVHTFPPPFLSSLFSYGLCSVMGYEGGPSNNQWFTGHGIATQRPQAHRTCA